MWNWFVKSLHSIALVTATVCVGAVGLAFSPVSASVSIGALCVAGVTGVVATATAILSEVRLRIEKKEDSFNIKEQMSEMKQKAAAGSKMHSEKKAETSGLNKELSELKATQARQELEIATLKSCLTSYQETNDETVRDNEIENQRQFQTINEGMIEIRAEVRSSRRSDNVSGYRLFNQNGTQVGPSAEVNAGVSPEGNHRGRQAQMR